MILIGKKSSNWIEVSLLSVYIVGPGPGQLIDIHGLAGEEAMDTLEGLEPHGCRGGAH
jgi:hypothetical protein